MADDADKPTPPMGAQSSKAGRTRAISRRAILFTISAAVVLAVLIVASDILLPFVIALVIAYVFTPSVLALERRRIPRWVAILGIYAVTLGSVYVFGRIAAPRISAEARAFSREVPKHVRYVEEELVPAWEARLRAVGDEVPPSPPQPAVTTTEEPRPALRLSPNVEGGYDVEVGAGFEIHPADGGGYRIEEIQSKKKGLFARGRQYLERNYVELARGGVALVGKASRFVFLFFMTLMLAAYLMLTHEKVIAFFRGLVRPAARGDFDSLLARIDAGLSGVVRGQLLICLVNGILTAIGFALIGLKYWPVLSLVAAVGSLVPIFGAILSSIPAVAIGLTQGIPTGFLVLGWIILIHQIEANYLNPKIIGTAAHLHPVLVVFVLLFGEHFFHVQGALLAVPVLSIARSLFLHFREVAERDEPDLAAGSESPP